jgi:hypothetical protein
MNFPKSLLADDTPFVPDPKKIVRHKNSKVVAASKEEVYINLRSGTVILTGNGSWKWLAKD